MHAVHVTFASFVAKVCPIHSVHFMLSVAALLAVAIYLPARRRFRVEALGLLVAPLGLVFVMGTFLLGRPEPEPRASPMFIALHVLSNLLGVALFLLAGGAAILYLVQDNRLKTKRHPIAKAFGALETLDLAVHRFLIAAFPMVTLGIVTGTYWARKLETGSRRRGHAGDLRVRDVALRGGGVAPAGGGGAARAPGGVRDDPRARLHARGARDLPRASGRAAHRAVASGPSASGHSDAAGVLHAAGGPDSGRLGT